MATSCPSIRCTSTPKSRMAIAIDCLGLEMVPIVFEDNGLRWLPSQVGLLTEIHTGKGEVMNKTKHRAKREKRQNKNQVRGRDEVDPVKDRIMQQAERQRTAQQHMTSQNGHSK